jgi:ATP/maltotriose-dependent transcriptional regulator MalT
LHPRPVLKRRIKTTTSLRRQVQHIPDRIQLITRSDETPRCSVATLGLPVGDQRVLGEEPG